MLEAKKFATLIACLATLALAPAAFAQVAAGYAIQLGQTAGAAHQMPHLDPRVGYGPQDPHVPADSGAQNQHTRHHQVQSDDNDDYESPADAAAARSADWVQVK